MFVLVLLVSASKGVNELSDTIECINDYLHTYKDKMVGCL